MKLLTNQLYENFQQIFMTEIKSKKVIQMINLKNNKNKLINLALNIYKIKNNITERKT